MLLHVVFARPEYKARIPNGDACDSDRDSGRLKESFGNCAFGHEKYATGGGPLNPFGNDFSKAGFKWTKELCQKDSDGDGVSNGQELGDPSCEFEPETTQRFTTGISNHGSAESGTPKVKDV